MMFREQVVAKELFPPMCHSATVEELEHGELYVVWYSGSFEGAPDTILMASKRNVDGIWSPPKVIQSLPGLPLGNPVLDKDGQDLVLYFVVLYGDWWTESKIVRSISKDGGQTWSHLEFVSLEKGLMLRTKPLRLHTGTLLLPIYDENNWTSLVLRSTDNGVSWGKYGDTTSRGKAIQPTLCQTQNGSVLMYMRSNKGQIYYSRSFNDGLSWIAAQPTDLLNPNSGIDLIKCDLGDLVLVYNPLLQGRAELAVSLSVDEGKTWEFTRVIAKGLGEYSYPTVIHNSNGLIQLVYTRNREAIIFCEFDRAWVTAG